MKLFLYKTLDDINVINKTLTDEIEININLKSNVNILNLELVLNGDFKNYNYAHIPDLNRYYFINTFEQINLRLIKLYLSCDVLETYKDDILKSHCRFKRIYKEGDNQKINHTETNKFNSVNIFADGETLEDNKTLIISTVIEE